jgi:cytochrome c
MAVVACGAAMVGLVLEQRFGARPVDLPVVTMGDNSGQPPAETFAAVFGPCAHCHQIGPGARHLAGPHLNGILGRKAGAIEGYPFSKAMRESGVVWDEAGLRRFIAEPQATVPGTRMIYGELQDRAAIDALVAFLRAPKP